MFLTAAKAVLDLDRADSMPLFVTFEPLPAVCPDFAADLHYGERLPPPDLVITLGVLLI